MESLFFTTVHTGPLTEKTPDEIRRPRIEAFVRGEIRTRDIPYSTFPELEAQIIRAEDAVRSLLRVGFLQEDPALLSQLKQRYQEFFAKVFPDASLRENALDEKLDTISFQFAFLLLHCAMYEPLSRQGNTMRSVQWPNLTDPRDLEYSFQILRPLEVLVLIYSFGLADGISRNGPPQIAGNQEVVTRIFELTGLELTRADVEVYRRKGIEKFSTSEYREHFKDYFTNGTQAPSS